MTELKKIVGYILKKYPNKRDLSNARVTKIIFLADWIMAHEKGKELSGIEWYFDNYGPYVDKVLKVVENNSNLFELKVESNLYGSKKNLFKILDNSYKFDVSKEEKDILDYVIEKTKSLSWSDFIKVVYSTFPIISSEKYSKLNLIKKAKEYEEQEKIEMKAAAS